MNVLSTLEKELVDREESLSRDGFSTLGVGVVPGGGSPAMNEMNRESRREQIKRK